MTNIELGNGQIATPLSSQFVFKNYGNFSFLLIWLMGSFNETLPQPISAATQ